MSNILPRSTVPTPVITLSGDLTLGGAMGLALLAIVLADPQGFRDRFFDLACRLVDARYSVHANSAEGTFEVVPTA